MFRIKKRLTDFDVMKTLSILLVVLAHVTRMYTPDGVVKIVTQSDFLTDITNFIYLFHMPAFVAISGAIFYFSKREKDKYNDNKQYIINRFVRLIIPYLIFVVFYVLPTLVFIGVENNILVFLVKNVLLLNGPNHLWYAVMIFNLFVLFNFFEDKIYKSNPILLLAIFFFVSYISFVVPNAIEAMKTLYYIFFFYLRYVFQKYKDRVLIKSTKPLSTLIILIILSLTFVLLYKVQIDFPFLIQRFLILIGALTGTIATYNTSYYLSKTNLMELKLAKSINNNSFGIYLFHPMIIYVLFYLVRDTMHNPYLGTLLIFLLSMIISGIFIFVVRKLNLNFAIGEDSPINRRLLKTR